MSTKPLADTGVFDFSTLQLQPRFKFKIGEKLYELTFVDAFAYAHGLVKQGNVGSAATIFQRLSEVTQQGTHAKIMWAYCCTRQGKLEEAKQLLLSSVEGDEELATNILEVFVHENLKDRNDILFQHIHLVNSYKELPVLCLLLGDVLQARNSLDKAKQCWQMAITRDKVDGPVAAAADKQMRKVA